MLENTLKLYDIRQVIVPLESRVNCYAFNAQMLEQNVFIEYFIDPLEDEDDLEDEDELEDEEKELENEQETPETRISVIHTHLEQYYEFMILRNTFEELSPTDILQKVLLLVEIIGKIPPGRLVEHLSSLAIDALVPHNIEEKKFSKMALKLLKTKMKLIKAAIADDTAQKN